MRLEIHQLKRLDLLDYQVELICTNIEEKNLISQGGDRLFKYVSVSSELEGKEEHIQALTRAIHEIYKEWEFIKERG